MVGWWAQNRQLIIERMRREPLQILLTGSTNPVFVSIITRHSYLKSSREALVTKLHNPKQNKKYSEQDVRVVFKWPRNLAYHRISDEVRYSVGPHRGPTLVKLSGALSGGIILMTMVGRDLNLLDRYVLTKTICLVFNVFGIAL